MGRTAEWHPDDRTGGPLDEVLTVVRERFPDIRIERLTATWPADDDNLWFLRRPGTGDEWQIACLPDGDPPFLVEADSGARVRTDDADEAARILLTGLADSRR